MYLVLISSRDRCIEVCKAPYLRPRRHPRSLGRTPRRPASPLAAVPPHRAVTRPGRRLSGCSRQRCAGPRRDCLYPPWVCVHAVRHARQSLRERRCLRVAVRYRNGCPFPGRDSPVRRGGAARPGSPPGPSMFRAPRRPALPKQARGRCTGSRGRKPGRRHGSPRQEGLLPGGCVREEDWCRLRDSNPRPSDYKSDALPAELNRHEDRRPTAVDRFVSTGQRRRHQVCSGDDHP